MEKLVYALSDWVRAADQINGNLDAIGRVLVMWHQGLPGPWNHGGDWTGQWGTPTAGDAPAGGMTINVDPTYAATLGNDAAFADCFLSAEEIASDPEAATFAASFVAATAAQLGVDPSSVQITGISTDGDTIPGCAGDAPAGGMTINVDPAYAATLGSDAAFADCFLTPEEIASDPEAAAFAANFIRATAAQLGVDPSLISVSGISTDGDTTPGCAGGSVSGMTINVDPAYTATLGTDAAFADCWLSADEIASDPEAAAFAASFIATTAASLGVDPSLISVSGISTDGDTTPGCASGQLGQVVVISLSPEFASSLGTDEAFEDCWLTVDEIASDPQAAVFAAQFIAVTAASLGIDASAIILTGISTDYDNIPGCAGPRPSLGSSASLEVNSDFATTLGDDAALADCWLSMDEIASDPEAAALAAVFIAETAATLGISPADLALTGFSTAGNPTPGCGTTVSSGSSLSIDVSSDFANTLGSTDALADCKLSVEEIAADAEAQALVDAFIQAQAEATGVDPADIVIQNINTFSDDCGSSDAATTTTSIDIHAGFLDTLGSADAFADCYLSASEIANDRDAAAFVAALAQVQADMLGIPVEDVGVDGMSTDADPTPGCQGGSGPETGRRRMQSGRLVARTHPGLTAAHGRSLKNNLIVRLMRQKATAGAMLKKGFGHIVTGVEVGKAELPADRVELTVDDGYVRAIASPAAWRDSVLSEGEIERSSSATALAAAFARAHALHKGVNASDVRVTQIARDVPARRVGTGLSTLYAKFA
jgi:hypothetical protein